MIPVWCAWVCVAAAAFSGGALLLWAGFAASGLLNGKSLIFWWLL